MSFDINADLDKRFIPGEPLSLEQRSSLLSCITQPAGVVLLSRSIRQCQSIQGDARTFSEQVIDSIICDSRCGVSEVVAFRIAPPIGGPSCF